MSTITRSIVVSAESIVLNGSKSIMISMFSTPEGARVYLDRYRGAGGLLHVVHRRALGQKLGDAFACNDPLHHDPIEHIWIYLSTSGSI